MRQSTLVFAAIMAVMASFGAGSAAAQKAERPAQKGPSPVIEVKPVEGIVVDYLANSDRERGEDESAAYVMGRITDFAGRSVRGAEVILFSLDSDERCTAEVRDEILALLAAEPAHDAYLVPRRSYMMGRWISGSAPSTPRT